MERGGKERKGQKKREEEEDCGGGGNVSTRSLQTLPPSQLRQGESGTRHVGLGPMPYRMILNT